LTLFSVRGAAVGDFTVWAETDALIGSADGARLKRLLSLVLVAGEHQ
jgi:hypothetical protein